MIVRRLFFFLLVCLFGFFGLLLCALLWKARCVGAILLLDLFSLSRGKDLLFLFLFLFLFSFLILTFCWAIVCDSPSTHPPTHPPPSSSCVCVILFLSSGRLTCT